MSDRINWRQGNADAVVAAVDSDIVIEIGDLLWQDVDVAKPASVIVDEASVFTLCEQFAGRFLGVAQQRSPAGDTTPVRVATTGVFEFHCPVDSYRLGDFVGATSRANQSVVPVLSRSGAIGRVAKREPSPTGNVLVDIRSTVMTGGV